MSHPCISSLQFITPVHHYISSVRASPHNNCLLSLHLITAYCHSITLLHRITASNHVSFLNLIPKCHYCISTLQFIIAFHHYITPLHLILHFIAACPHRKSLDHLNAALMTAHACCTSPSDAVEFRCIAHCCMP